MDNPVEKYEPQVTGSQNPALRFNQPAPNSNCRLITENSENDGGAKYLSITRRRLAVRDVRVAVLLQRRRCDGAGGAVQAAPGRVPPQAPHWSRRRFSTGCRREFRRSDELPLRLLAGGRSAAEARRALSCRRILPIHRRRRRIR